MSSQSIGIAKLKDHLSEVLREVEAGADIVVVDRRRPIARIVPISREAGPTVTIIPATRQLDARDRQRRRPTRWTIRSLDVLKEDRRRR
jgi:prevent-host-death family protein